MALSVFPERMNPINPEDVEASLRTLERYVSYMVERVEFALSKNFRTTTELGEAAEETAVSLEEAVESLRTINDAVSGLADDMDGKVDKVPGKGLSTNDYTTAEQTKLAGIETGAEVNAIETVKRNGTDLPVTDKAVDIAVPVNTSELTNDSGFQTAAEIADGYLPLTGGTLTGSLTLDPTGASGPILTLVNAEKSGVGPSRMSLRKNASASADSGTFLTDLTWGNGSAAQKQIQMVLRAASPNLSGLLYLSFRDGAGGVTTYYIYGTHNPPAVANVTGLEARLSAIEARLTALES